MTQADVARAAGVSQATVSMILNRRAHGRVSDDTRERVLRVVRESGYVPNPAARSMAGASTRVLGVYTFEPVFPMDSRDFYFPFLLGVERTAEAMDYDLLLFSSSRGGHRRLYADDGSRLMLADGALLIGQRPIIEDIERLRDDGYPFVYIGRVEVRGDPISYVACDYTGATRQLTADLVSRGHRAIAYVRHGDDPSQSSHDRELGYRQAVRAAGLPAPSTPTWNVVSTEDVRALAEGVRSSGISALMFEQQADAEAFVAAGASYDLVVPTDVSVVVLNLADPRSTWTGLMVPRQEMGEIATALVIEATRDTPPEAVHRLVDGVLVTGSSVREPGH
jgi:DNA-binding LacI/PurR family transcriptional regulator